MRQRHLDTSSLLPNVISHDEAFAALFDHNTQRGKNCIVMTPEQREHGLLSGSPEHGFERTSPHDTHAAHAGNSSRATSESQILLIRTTLNLRAKKPLDLEV